MSIAHNTVVVTCGPHRAEYRINTVEADARRAADQADQAVEALRRAIYAYECAGYGSHVTQPLREALANVEFSISEVRS